MGHISNMGHSLDAIKFIANLHVAIGSPTVNIYIKETYPFFDEDAYKDEVEKYLVENNNDDLRKILKRHLSTCEQIIEIWDGRKELWEARSRLKADRENNEDTNVSYDIYCILGGRRNNSMRFYGKVLLLRNINGKVEERSPFIPFTLFDKSWREYNLEIHPIPDTDRKTLTVHLVRYAEIIRRFLREHVNNEDSLPTAEQPQQKELYFTRSFTDTERQKLFDGLVSGGFIPKGTTPNHFFFVFGGTETLDFKPLQWLGTIKELNYFINKFSPNEKYKWDKAVKCFIRNNAPINKKSLSTAIDKYDTPPEKSTMIDDLLK